MSPPSVEVLRDARLPSRVRDLSKPPEALYLHGELPRENDHVLSQRFQDAKRLLELRGRPVEWWLADGSVRRWLSTIEKLERDLKRPPNFPEVRTFQRKATTSGQLRDMNMSFVYAQYSGASQVLHGSTVALYLSLGDEAIALGGPSRAFLAQKLGLANVVLRNCWVLLEMVREEMWGVVDAN